MTYRAQGNNALSGLFIGRDAVARHVQQLVERTKGPFEAFKWDDWLVGRILSGRPGVVHAQSTGRSTRVVRVTVVAFNVADEIDAITVFFEDPAGMDRFIGP